MEYIDKEVILDFFNVGGNIMDFSIERLSKFSKNVIGKDIKVETLSKGKSLENFIIYEGSDREIIKLCENLLKYYKRIYCKNYPYEFDPEGYREIQSIINRYKNSILSFNSNGNKIQNKQNFIERLKYNNSEISSLITRSDFYFKDTKKYSYYYPNGKKGTWNKIGMVVFILADNSTINNWESIKYNLDLIFQDALDINSKYEVVDVKYRKVNKKDGFNLSNELSNRIISISNRDATFTKMATNEKISIINNTIENMLKSKRKFIHINEEKYFHLITNDDIKNYRQITQCFRHGSNESLKERKEFNVDQKNFLIEYGVMIINALDKFEKLT